MHKSLKTLRLLAVLALLLPCGLQNAHADDFGLWSELELTNDLGKTGFGADLDLGFRANNNLRNVDRWNIGVGLRQSLTSFLRIGGGYSFIHSYNPAEQKDHFKSSGAYNGYNLTHTFWRDKSRFYLDLRGKVSLGRLKLTLRERYQATLFYHAHVQKDKYRCNAVMDAVTGQVINYLWTATDANGNPAPDDSDIDRKHEKTTNYLRSRLQAEYNIPKCPITPYVSYELSHNLAKQFTLDKRRIGAGIEWKVKKGQHLGIGYIYNKGEDDDEGDRLHAVEVSYAIKGVFFK